MVNRVFPLKVHSQKKLVIAVHALETSLGQIGILPSFHARGMFDYKLSVEREFLTVISGGELYPSGVRCVQLDGGL